MEYLDQEISCSDCGGMFTFTAGEQEFYARKGFISPPKRCKQCRESRRQQRGGGGGGSDGVYRAPGFRDDAGDRGGGGGGYRTSREMGGGGGGRGGVGGGRGGVGGGRGSDSQRPQYEIQCAQCGQRATVPFRPAQGKPVYCRDCYQGKRGDDGGNR